MPRPDRNPDDASVMQKGKKREQDYTATGNRASKRRKNDEAQDEVEVKPEHDGEIDEWLVTALLYVSELFHPDPRH